MRENSFPLLDSVEIQASGKRIDCNACNAIRPLTFWPLTCYPRKCCSDTYRLSSPNSTIWSKNISKSGVKPQAVNSTLDLRHIKILDRIVCMLCVKGIFKIQDFNCMCVSSARYVFTYMLLHLYIHIYQSLKLIWNAMGPKHFR